MTNKYGRDQKIFPNWVLVSLKSLDPQRLRFGSLLVKRQMMLVKKGWQEANSVGEVGPSGFGMGWQLLHLEKADVAEVRRSNPGELGDREQSSHYGVVVGISPSHC